MTKTCGDRIRLCLQLKHGKRVPWLAKKLKVKHQGLYEMLRRTEQPRRIDEIAKILDVPLSWLLTGQPIQPWETAPDYHAAPDAALNYSGDPVVLQSALDEAITGLRAVLHNLERAVTTHPRGAVPIAPTPSEHELTARRNRVQLRTKRAVGALPRVKDAVSLLASPKRKTDGKPETG